MRKSINGKDFQKMLSYGLANLMSAEKVVNSMNVFPVADGDTGINMRLTLEHGYKLAKSNRHLGQYINEVAKGMLLGARGNSGVILSQLFKGMAIALQSKGIVNPGELKDAFISAYKNAYHAVINPVEGTILTVAREGVENIKHLIKGKAITIDETLKLYIDEMNKSLKRTPELLPALKEASVLDSGAFGYIIIIEGMYKCLIGERISNEVNIPQIEETNANGAYFDENSAFLDGYCMEFLLQLLNSKNFKTRFNLDEFIESIKPLGNSIVALQEGTIVKVHIHTLDPSKIINIAREYGEFISFKLENMQLQHNEYSVLNENKKTEDAKELGVIVVANGDEISKYYREMGVDVVLDGGPSMNTSSDEFVHAIESINAKKMAICPNNANTVLAAQQAVYICNAKDSAYVIESKTMMEGYYALQMDMPDESGEDRINAFKENINLVTTIGVSIASKDYDGDDFKCSKGEFIATINNKLAAKGTDALDTFKNALQSLEDLSDKYAMIAYVGKGYESLLDSTNELLDEEFSDIEHAVNQGNQDVYIILAGLL